MKFDKSKLEKWVEQIPECEEFLNGFFLSCGEDTVSAFVNYKADIRSYSLTHEAIKENSERLLEAFEDISGMKVYYE